jgi:threonine dehydratase
MDLARETGSWRRFAHIQVVEAAARLKGVVIETPLVPITPFEGADHDTLGDPRIELRAKLENRQETGSFKARGAWNQVAQLSEAERHAGVVCASSGNHGKALSWAAHRAGVPATIVMPANAYPNKIRSCRDLGAEVVLAATRELADVECAKRVKDGMTLVHPHDAERTIEGAGTVGLEIAAQWPEVDVVVVPVGGGGLLCGTALALRQALGDRICVVGAEPRGAPSLTLGLEAGAPVFLDKIESRIQGLTPVYSGRINIDIARATVDAVVLFEDDAAFAAQKHLVAQGEVVEPAGAAAAGLVLAGLLPERLLEGRTASRPLRVAVVVSGGNPDPSQLESVRAEVDRERSTLRAG